MIPVYSSISRNINKQSFSLVCPPTPWRLIRLRTLLRWSPKKCLLSMGTPLNKHVFQQVLTCFPLKSTPDQQSLVDLHSCGATAQK